MNLSRLIYQLLKSEPFYANFILNCEIQYNVPSAPTAAVCFQNGRIKLAFNTKFMSSLPEVQQIAILKHEVLHMLMDHTDLETYNKLNAHVWNIAMDCAINQHIDNLPAEAITVAELEKLTKQKLNKLDTCVYYYNALAQHAEKMGNIKPIDQHGDPNEQSTLDKTMQKAAVAEMAQKACVASAGNVPQSLQKLIEELAEKPQVSWKTQLKNFVASAISSKTRATRSKAHRRFNLDSPGKKKKRELKLAVCIDTSGSVSDEMLSVFINEIIDVKKNCAELNLIYADCEIQKIINIKQNEKIPKMRHGNGGTAYQPAIEKACQLKANAIIYFGDMDTADTPKNPGIPVLWASIGSKTKPGNFGKLIELNLK